MGIVGLGYVGLPLALSFAANDCKVVGFDTDHAKVDQLNKGNSYIERIGSEQIGSARKNGFVATGDPAQLADCDALIICVPTPLDDHREPDLSFVCGSLELIIPHLRNGQIACLESTTYPGTTEEVLRPMLEGAGFDIGENFFLAYSPEREDPGNPDYSTRTIPKVVSGSTSHCLEVATALYELAIDTLVPVSSTQAAELTKLLENIHRAVNIGLVNEMKLVAAKMGLDIHEIIRAAATKPFGFVPYYPGPGLGGHCIPIDPFYLTWKAREYNVHTRFIELAGEVNSAMPDYVIKQTMLALNAHGRSIKGSKILVLGVAYKKNVDDMRESPSLVLIEKLNALGALVTYCDPHVPNLPRLREYDFDMSSIDMTEQSLQDHDCVLLATDHDGFDYQLIEANAALIVDSRGRFQPDGKTIFAA